ncbi:helix-turn-helix domain-containing protein [Variovorax sp. RCC_210]|uniref:helix-turn-helix domain-containing protein n=1 Tax=Variovorax sp. RCC_210 TaxID=3239217 RepID=UPI00352510CC
MFNSGRLSIARQRRQLTKKGLAELAGITPLTLTRLEGGATVDPERGTLEALARALQYPLEFFFGDDADVFPEEAVSFRSLSSLTARQKEAALAAGHHALMVDRWARERFELPTADFIDLRGEDPESAAIALRSHWGLGTRPVPDMVKLLESKGVRIFSLEEANLNVDAYSCWTGGIPFAFLNTMKSAERSRFDAAHELGHLVLHIHGTFGSRDNERDADRFASAFLIPRDDLISIVPHTPKLSKLIELKKRWGVSVAALARATFEVGLLSDWHYKELCKQISIAGYRREEPLGMARERSVLWRKVFEALWAEGLSKDQVAKLLTLPVDQLRALTSGVLDEKDLPALSRPEKPQLRVV